MSDVQIPTCGRIVHYYPNGGDAHCSANTANVVPAMVVQTFGTAINLSVFPMNTDATNVLRYSVLHKSNLKTNEDGTPVSGLAYWDWPAITQ